MPGDQTTPASAGTPRLCTICARGGSKGVPGKNLRPLLGRPLVSHSVLAARASGLFDMVAVSSDSEAILAAGADAGADVLVRRPDDLADDHSSKLAAIQHAARSVQDSTGQRFDTFVDLDATSPLRTVDDIRGAVDLLATTGAGNVITGCPARRSPYFNLVEVGPAGVVSLVGRPHRPIVRRQDAPACFDMNASIYVWRPDSLFAAETVILADTRLYVMPRERSVDLDDELDFTLIELLSAGRHDLRWASGS